MSQSIMNEIFKLVLEIFIRFVLILHHKENGLNAKIQIVNCNLLEMLFRKKFWKQQKIMIMKHQKSKFRNMKMK